MSIFVIFLLGWYCLQFIEAWVYAGAGTMETGKPVGTLWGILGTGFLFLHVFLQTDGPLTWQGWVLGFYYLLNVGYGFTLLVRGPRTDEWGVPAALTVTAIFAGILALWFTGVLV